MTTQESRQKTYYFRLNTCNTATIKKALQKAGIIVLSAMD